MNNKRSLIVILLIIFLIILGVYSSICHAKIEYDFSILDKSNLFNDYTFKYLRQVKTQDVPEQFRYISLDPLGQLNLNSLKKGYLIVEFKAPLEKLSKITLEQDGKTTEFPPREDNFFICKVESFDALLSIYAPSKVINVFNVDELKYTKKYSFDSLYYALCLSVIILLINLFILKNKPLANLNYKHILKDIFVLICIVVVCLLIRYIFTLFDLGININFKRLIFMSLSIFSLYLIFTYKDRLEVLIPLLIICLGIIFMTATGTKDVSWDEGTHYLRCNKSSYLLNIQESSPTLMFTNMNTANKYFVYDSPLYLEYVNRLNLSSSYVVNSYAYTFSFSNFFFGLPYIIPGIIIWFLRSLGLNFEAVYMLSKLGVMLPFALMVHYSIKKSGNKLLISALMLIPSIVFLSSSHSYDPWTIGFLTLALVTFIETKKHKKQFTNSDILLVMLSMFAISTSKTAYLCFAIVLLFVKRENFASKRQMIAWYLSIILILIITILAYKTSIYFEKDYVGMQNNNPYYYDVNIKAQVSYILENPMNYLKMLFKYLFAGYFSLEFVPNMLMAFEYDIIPLFRYILMPVLVAIAFTEKDKYDYNINKSNKIALLLSSLITIIVLATAIYIDYNPYRNTTINGMQSRYMLPILYPILYSVSGPFAIKTERIKKMNIIIPLIFTVIILFGIFSIYIYPMFIPKYY